LNHRLDETEMNLFDLARRFLVDKRNAHEKADAEENPDQQPGDLERVGQMDRPELQAVGEHRDQRADAHRAEQRADHVGIGHIFRDVDALVVVRRDLGKQR
jgi:hypothetical protein